DGAVRHRAGGEAPHNRRPRLDLVQRHGRTERLELEQAAQMPASARELVDLRRVLGEHLVAALTRRVLEQEYGLRVEQVQLALAPPLVLAAHLEAAMRSRRRYLGVGRRIPRRRLGGD